MVMASRLVQDVCNFVSEVKRALCSIPRALGAGNDPDGILLNAELLLRDTVLVESLMPLEEGQQLTGSYVYTCT